MESICAYARSQGLGLHLDGSRLFLATPYTGVSVKRYAALFDTVYVSTWKYFNANFGAILAGPEKLLKDLYHQRRMFGGGIPHVWAEAAVTLHYSKVSNNDSPRPCAMPTRCFGLWARAALKTEPTSRSSARPTRIKELRAAGIVIGAPRGNEVSVQTNETLLRRAPDELAELLRAV
jgi:threonine aldolase